MSSAKVMKTEKREYVTGRRSHGVERPADHGAVNMTKL
jgi:hypothetical protein